MSQCPVYEKLKGMETSDFQGRKGGSLKSDMPDFIGVDVEVEEREYEVLYGFKNTTENSALGFVENHLKENGIVSKSVAVEQAG